MTNRAVPQNAINTDAALMVWGNNTLGKLNSSEQMVCLVVRLIYRFIKRMAVFGDMNVGVLYRRNVNINDKYNEKEKY